MEYFLHILIIINIFIPLALSLDLVVGRTGILSILHAGMYGLGAYTTAILTKTYGFEFLPSVLLGVLLVGCFAYFISTIFSRLRGDYYALGSFGASIILFSLFMNLTSLTSGPNGIANIPPPSLFGFTVSTNWEFFFFTFIILGILFLIFQLVTASRFGLIIQAVRDEPLTAKVYGYNVEAFKNIAFTISACIASVSGSLYAVYISYINPNSFTLNESILILAMIIIGGLASKSGVILGTIFVIVLPELLRFAGFPESISPQMQLAAYGAILLYLMYKRPTGILGKYRL